MKGQQETAALTAGAAWLFLAAAAAAASLPTALLMTAAVCLTLAVTWLLALVLQPLGKAWSTLLCLTADGGIAWGMWAVFSWREFWRDWAGPYWLFAALMLLCAPAAVELATDDRKERRPSSLFRLIGVVLLIGLIRELLGAGTLFRLRLFPALSDNFLYGAAGVLIAGLCLPLAGWRERRLFRCPDRECLSAGAAYGLRTAIGGLPGALLVWLAPDAPLPGVLWITILFCAAAGTILERFSRREPVRMALTDGVLAVIAAVSLTAAFHTARAAGAIWLCFVSLWVGMLAGLGLCLFTALYNRIDSMHLPARMKVLPAVLVAVGGAMLAFQVIPFGS